VEEIEKIKENLHRKARKSCCRHSFLTAAFSCFYCESPCLHILQTNLYDALIFSHPKGSGFLPVRNERILFMKSF